MSLINDALRRVKNTRQPDPPPPVDADVQYRPASRRPAPQLNSKFLLAAAVVAAVFLVTGLFLTLKPDGPNQSARARTLIRPAAPPVATAKLPPGHRAPQPANLNSPNTAVPATAGTPAPAIGDINAAPALARTVPLSPAPPKLQGIFFDPVHPSAIIDGRRVLVGSYLREYRVTKIAPDGATLVSPVETLVLKLK